MVLLVAWMNHPAAGASAASGLMKLELKDGKVMAEIPASLMGKKLAMASLIEMTSDSGEGVAGQMSDNCIHIIFSVSEKNLVVSVPQDGLLHEGIPGEWKRYKITSFKPSGAAVVDLTDLFKTQSSQLYTFPKNAYNSMGGQVRRVHKMIDARSKFLEVTSGDSLVSVLGDFCYDMDGYVMGVMKIAGDYSLRALVRKMIFLPREGEPLPTFKADRRVGTDSFEQKRIDAASGPVLTERLVSRWRLEPSDSAAWNRGELVEPVRPITFYIDTLMPANWLPYVREGVNAWNEAFVSAGFRNAVRTEVFPSDQSFVSHSPYISRILFAPSGMEEVEVSKLQADGSSEISSALICIHSSALKKWHRALVMSAASSCPAVRTSDLSDPVAGPLVRLMVMQAVGKALGLKENAAASSVYPVDSLRSASFTGQYGITSSVTEQMVFNYIASAADVAEGAKLVQNVTGPYDRFAIGWLYGPQERRSPAAMKESETNPYLYYSSFPDRRNPLAARADLGDDAFLSLDRWVASQKEHFAHLHEWYAGEDEAFVTSIVSGVTEQYARYIVQILQHIGGYCVERSGRALPLAAEVQKHAVKDVVARLRDMEWFRSIPAGRLPYGTNEFIGDVYRTNLFNSLLGRVAKVKACRSDFSEADFFRTVSDEIFGTSAARIRLSPIEMVWQEAYLTFLAERRNSSAAACSELVRLCPMLLSASKRASSEVALHYSYLHFITDRNLKEDI